MRIYRTLGIATVMAVVLSQIARLGAMDLVTALTTKTQNASPYGGPMPPVYGGAEMMSCHGAAVPTCPGGSTATFFQTKADPPIPWTIDYRARLTYDSHTSYEFGDPDSWSPISRLQFPINSLWHGLDVGLRSADWGVHFQWFTPMQRQIDGDMYDYDWMLPPPADFTHLGILDQRWTDGQMLDLGVEFRLLQDILGWNLDLWPTMGVRWQRFNIMTYNAVQVMEWGEWQADPFRFAGDTIAFKQEYYVWYFGGQLRSTFGTRFPLTLTFQGDWGYATGRNKDHHLLRAGDRYTLENTEGDSFHLGLTSELAVTSHLSIGLDFEYMHISTVGRHRMRNDPLDIDETWTEGVRVWSDQTWVTAFVRFRR